MSSVQQPEGTMRTKFSAICCIVLTICLCGSISPAQIPEAKVKKSTSEAFEDAIHYLRIAKWELAKGNLEYVAIYGDPIEVLVLSAKLKGSENTLLDALDVKEVAVASQDVLKVLDQGRAAQQQDPKLIEEEIVKLGGTSRARRLAQEKLNEIYKEYAVPQLLRALADDKRANLHSGIVGVLSQMGKSAVDPLVVSLADKDPVLKGHTSPNPRRHCNAKRNHPYSWGRAPARAAGSGVRTSSAAGAISHRRRSNLSRTGSYRRQDRSH